MSSNVFEFESVTCSRCGGSGHYSYCQMYGTTCFKCAGAGTVYTKRGAVAYAAFSASLKVPASSIVAGDRIYLQGIPGIARGQWITIVAVEHQDDGYISFRSAKAISGYPGCFDYTCGAESIVRKGWSAEDKRAKYEEAIALQSSLTKSGTPRKR